MKDSDRLNYVMHRMDELSMEMAAIGQRMDKERYDANGEFQQLLIESLDRRKQQLQKEWTALHDEYKDWLENGYEKDETERLAEEASKLSLEAQELEDERHRRRLRVKNLRRPRSLRVHLPKPFREHGDRGGHSRARRLPPLRDTSAHTKAPEPPPATSMGTGWEGAGRAREARREPEAEAYHQAEREAEGAQDPREEDQWQEDSVSRLLSLVEQHTDEMHGLSQGPGEPGATAAEDYDIGPEPIGTSLSSSSVDAPGPGMSRVSPWDPFPDPYDLLDSRDTDDDLSDPMSGMEP